MMKKWFVSSLVVFFISPIVVIIMKSVSGQWRWPNIVPEEINLHAWSAISSDPKIVTAVLLTAFIGLLVTLLNLMISVPAARCLAFYQFKGISLIDLLLTGPILIPALAVAFGLHMTFLRLGIANQLIGVVFIHLVPTIPYSIRIFRSSYERLGRKYVEQAATLGVSGWVTFLTVEVPLLLPTFRAVWFLVHIISFSQFALTAIIGGGSVITLAMIYFPYFQTAQSSFIAAYSLVFMLLALFSLVLFELLAKLIKLIIYSRGVSLPNDK